VSFGLEAELRRAVLEGLYSSGNRDFMDAMFFLVFFIAFYIYSPTFVPSLRFSSLSFCEYQGMASHNLSWSSGASTGVDSSGPSAPRESDRWSTREINATAWPMEGN